MLRIAGFAAGALALALATPARAHQGGVDVRGVVRTVAPDRLEVTTAKGELAFALTPATEFVRGSAPADRGDVQAGDRVVVHARERGGRLEAVRVQIGKRAAGR